MDKSLPKISVDNETYKAFVLLGEKLHEPPSKEQRRRAIELYYLVMEKLEIK